MKGMLLFLLLLLMAMLVMSDRDDGDSDGDGCDWEDGVKMMLMRMMTVSCQVLVPTSKPNP